MAGPSLHRTAALIITLIAIQINVVWAGSGGTTPDNLTRAIVRAADYVNPSGDLRLSIPLLTVPGRNGLDYPIILTYQSNVRPTQRATWVGLGFGLQTGSVTRNVNYRPDEQRIDMFGSGGFRLDNNIAEDQGPGAMITPGDPFDWYILNLPGESHRIEMVPDAGGTPKPYVSPWNKWKIGYNVVDPYDFRYNQNLGGFIPNWAVLQDDGTRMWFRHRSQVEIVYASQPWHMNYKYPVSWELTDILSSDYHDANGNGPDATDYGSWITFAYDNYAHSDYNATPIDHSSRDHIMLGRVVYGRDGAAGPTCQGDTDVGGFERFADIRFDQSCVQRIDTPTHYALFTTSPRSDLIGDNGVRLRRLDRIDLYSRSNPTMPITTVHFQYRDQASSLRGELTLDFVQIAGMPPLRFDYQYNAPPVPLSCQGPELRPNPNAWNLTQLELPTGGRVTYEYEAAHYQWFHTGDGTYSEATGLAPFTLYYRDAPVTWRGLGRLRRVVLGDGLGGLDTTEYTYGEGVAVNSQVTSRRAPTSSTNQYGLSEPNIAELRLDHLMYRSITTHLPEQQGTVTRYFTTDVAEGWTRHGSGTGVPSPAVDPRESHPDIYSPASQRWDVRQDERGVLWRETEDAEGQSLATTNYYNSYPLRALWDEPSILPITYGKWFWYKRKATWVRRDSIVTRRDGVTSRKLFFYETPGGQQTQVTQYQPDGTQVAELTTYVHTISPQLAFRNVLAPVASRRVVEWRNDTLRTLQASRIGWAVQPRGYFVAYPETLIEWRGRSGADQYHGMGDPQEIVGAIRTFDVYGNIVTSTDASGVVTRRSYTNNAGQLSAESRGGAAPVYADDFETANGARLSTRSMAWALRGDAAIVDGFLRLRGGSYAAHRQAVYSSFGASFEGWCGGTSVLSLGIHFGTSSEDLQDGTAYAVRIMSDGRVRLSKGLATLAEVQTGQPWPEFKGTWRRYRVIVADGACKVICNGLEVFSSPMSPWPPPAGQVNLFGEGTQGEMVVDNFRVAGPEAEVTSYAYTSNWSQAPMWSEGEAVGTVDVNGVAKFECYNAAGMVRQIWKGLAEGPASGDVYTLCDEYGYVPLLGEGMGTPNAVVHTTYVRSGSAELRVAFSDGFGRAIQETVQLGDSIEVTARTHNWRGEVAREYVPYRTSAAGLLSFDENFHSNAVIGCPAAQGSAFSEYRREKAPSGRLVAIGAPGLASALGSGKEILYTYGANGVLDSVGTPVGTVMRASRRDENGRLDDVFTNGAGNIVLSRVDRNGLRLATGSIVDGMGRILVTRDPDGLETVNSYDARGLRLRVSHPDRGTEDVLYDRVGRPRLIRDGGRQGVHTPFSHQGTTSGYQPVTGSFGVGIPCEVELRATISSALTPADAETVRITGPGIVTVAEVVATVSSPIVSKVVLLPKGTYDYVARQAGYGDCSYAIRSLRVAPCSYVKYDHLGRISERGEALVEAGEDPFQQDNADNGVWPTSGAKICSRWEYDRKTTNVVQMPQHYLVGRVASQTTYSNYGPPVTEHFSYDEYGNIRARMWEHAGRSVVCETRYDGQMRPVRRTVRDLGSGERVVHMLYRYGLSGRLDSVVVAFDGDSSGMSAQTVVRYAYDSQGLLSRKVAAGAQGIDYRYTARGWVKSINAASLAAGDDPGGDPRMGTAQDKFGCVYDYDELSPGAVLLGAAPRYDGSVAAVEYAIEGLGVPGTTKRAGSQRLGVGYAYDSGGRLTRADYGVFALDLPLQYEHWYNLAAWDEREWVYSRSGAFLRGKRYGPDGGLMDNLTYQYAPSSHRLTHITDAVNASAYSGDIDGQVAGSIAYTGEGSIERNVPSGLQWQERDVEGCPSRAYLNIGVVAWGYSVDMRPMWMSGAVGSQYFCYDESGELVYTFESGTGRKSLIVRGVGLEGELASASGGWHRYYYLTDNVGSVRACVDSAGDVVAAVDYGPYGGSLLGRAISVPNSALVGFGHGGRVRDGATGFMLAGAREYDTRLGVWSAVDAEYERTPSIAPYVYCAGDPTKYVDPDGRWIETAWDVANVYLGVRSVVADIQGGNYQWAIVGAVAVAADIVATATPGVTVNASGMVKAARDVSTVANLAEGARGAKTPTEALRGIARQSLFTAAGNAGFRSKVSSSLGAVGRGSGLKPIVAPASRSNFRDKVIAYTGKAPRGGEAHHMLPWSLKEQFAKLGYNVNDPRYGGWWKEGAHQAYRNAYERDLERWLSGPGGKDPEALEDFLETMARKYKKYGLEYERK